MHVSSSFCIHIVQYSILLGYMARVSFFSVSIFIFDARSDWIAKQSMTHSLNQSSIHLIEEEKNTCENTKTHIRSSVTARMNIQCFRESQ